MEIYQFKARNSEIKSFPLCLRNILKDFAVENMKKTGLLGYVYDFSVAYNITNIHEYLMIKMHIHIK